MSCKKTSSHLILKCKKFETKIWFNEIQIFPYNHFSTFVYNIWTAIINSIFAKYLFSNPKLISPFESRNLWRWLKRPKTGFPRFDNFSRNGNLRREFKLNNHGKWTIWENLWWNVKFDLFFVFLLALSWKFLCDQVYDIKLALEEIYYTWKGS